MLNSFGSTFQCKLIYVFRINDRAHRGYLKIGDATLAFTGEVTEILPNSEVLNDAATKRIDNYTSTAGISYELFTHRSGCI